MQNEFLKFDYVAMSKVVFGVFNVNVIFIEGKTS